MELQKLSQIVLVYTEVWFVGLSLMLSIRIGPKLGNVNIQTRANKQICGF